MQAKATEGVISQPVSEQADAGPPTVLTAQPQKTPPSMPTPRQRHSQVDESKPGLLGREAKDWGRGQAERNERNDAKRSRPGYGRCITLPQTRLQVPAVS
jgi:hypothetical protein